MNIPTPTAFQAANVDRRLQKVNTERERERKRKRKREKKARKYARRHEINDESFSTGCGIFVLLLYF
jgi:hypothetical protein